MLISNVRGPTIVIRNGRDEHGELSLYRQVSPEPIGRNLHSSQNVESTEQALRVVPREHRNPRRAIDPHGTANMLAEGLSRVRLVTCDHFDTRKSCGGSLDAAQDFAGTRKRHAVIFKDEYTLRPAELHLFVHNHRMRGCACDLACRERATRAALCGGFVVWEAHPASPNIPAIECGKEADGEADAIDPVFREPFTPLNRAIQIDRIACGASGAKCAIASGRRSATALGTPV